MGKIIFVFSGQGDQHPGMGKYLYDNFSEARDVFLKADALRPGTSEMCFEGSEEDLRETKNTQPCMFALEMSATAVLDKAGIHGDMAAGFSLGELAALTYAGGVDFEKGFELVCRRSELMQEAAEKQDTAMAAVIGLSREKVKEISEKFPEVYPVNYNCPGQISVSGRAESMREFYGAVKDAGGRALPLKVKGAFHSPFMNTTAEKFGEFLKNFYIREPEIPLYSDYTGRLYSGDASLLLSRQICNSVLWEDIVKSAVSMGVDRFIELGPGRTLCNLIGKIDSSVRTYPTRDGRDFDKIFTEVK